MKKILFNDRFGFTNAVLEGRKTMTRRVIPPIEVYWSRRGIVTLPVSSYKDGLLFMDTSSILPDLPEYLAPAKYQPKYKVGDVVAVAQSYSEVGLSFIDYADPTFKRKRVPEWGYTKNMKGWRNKMYVRADVMPHQIRITNVRIERLQDISDEDCLKEGIYNWKDAPDCPEAHKKSQTELYGYDRRWDGFLSPREAFADLINRISGKKTWKDNPWVYVYEFELVK